MRILNLLHIEDNEGDLALTKEALSELDLSVDVTTAKDGKKGIDYLESILNSDKNKLPDLIFLDINLPILNGFEVLKAVKTNLGLKHIPVIIFSTSSYKNDVLKAYDLSANCFVTKPVEVIEFFSAIKCIMKFWTKTTKIPSLS